MSSSLLRNESQLPSTRTLVTPDKLHIKIFTNLDNPCAGVPVWPSTVKSFLGGYAYAADLEELRVSIESAGSTNVGDLWIIAEQTVQPIGTGLFQRHTGEVAEFVGLGNGVEGSAWNFQSFPSGSLISMNGDSAGWVIIVDEVGTTYYSSNGGTGKIPIPYIDVNYDDIVPNSISLHTQGTGGIQTNRVDFLDPCRRMQLLWSEDFVIYQQVEPQVLYTEAQLLDGIVTTGLFPVEAVAAGVRWLRGGALQYDRTF